MKYWLSSAILWTSDVSFGNIASHACFRSFLSMVIATYGSISHFLTFPLAKLFSFFFSSFLLLFFYSASNFWTNSFTSLNAFDSLSLNEELFLKYRLTHRFYFKWLSPSFSIILLRLSKATLISSTSILMYNSDNFLRKYESLRCRSAISRAFFLISLQ